MGSYSGMDNCMCPKYGCECLCVYVYGIVCSQTVFFGVYDMYLYATTLSLFVSDQSLCVNTI